MKLQQKPMPQVTPKARPQAAAHMARILRMLAHPQRLCMMCLLAEKPRPVAELVAGCGLAQAQVSQFLARMKLEGFVESEAIGRQRVYRIADAQALATMQALHSVYCGTAAPKRVKK